MTKPAPESMGYQQSVADRRLFYKIDKQTGKLLLAVVVRVDGNCCDVFDKPPFDEFEQKWKDRYGKPKTNAIQRAGQDGLLKEQRLDRRAEQDGHLLEAPKSAE
jgi:hypothetical protein